MKKIHLILLLLVMGAIIGMSFFIRDLATQETFASAAKKKDQFVVVKVQLDKSVPVQYDAVRNPNQTTFWALDASGTRTKVVLAEAKPTDMERSEGINLNGWMRDGYFECRNVQLKCPSKYKDDMKQSEKNLGTTTSVEYK